MMRERHAELASGAAGLRRERGVAYDERGSCLVECFDGIGFFHRVIAHGVGVELALDNRRSRSSFDEQVCTIVATAANAADGVTRRREEIGYEPLVVGACLNCREVVRRFECATGDGCRLPRYVGGADSGEGVGAAGGCVGGVSGDVGDVLPRLLG